MFAWIRDYRLRKSEKRLLEAKKKAYSLVEKYGIVLTDARTVDEIRKLDRFYATISTPYCGTADLGKLVESYKKKKLIEDAK